MWRYVSLKREAERVAGPIGDVWSVESVGQGAVWVTDNRALRWDGLAFSVWALPASPRLIGLAGETGAWIYQQSAGLLSVGAKGDPQVVVKESDLPESTVTWLAPLRDQGTKDKTSYLIGLGDAAYRWNSDGHFERLNELSAALADTVPTIAVRLERDRIAIGTLKAGIVLATESGQVIQWISTQTGLPDDNVHALWAQYGKLWAALGNGLARIDRPGQAMQFNRDSGLGFGAPVKVIERAGKDYVLTSRSLLAVDQNAGKINLQPLLQAEANLHDAATIGDSLWVGGFAGAWQVDAFTQTAVQSYYVSADIFKVTATVKEPKGVLVLENYTPKLLIPSPHGGWAARDLGVTLPDTPVSFLERSEGASSEVWASTMTTGIYCFAWQDTGDAETLADKRFGLRLKAHYRSGQGLPAGVQRASLVTFGSQLYAFTESGILRLHDESGQFEAAPELADYIGIAATESTTGTTYWLVQAKRTAGLATYGVLRVKAGKGSDPLVIEPLEVAGLDDVGSITGITLTHADGSGVLWLGGSRGLLRVELAGVNLALTMPPEAEIQSIRANDKLASTTGSPGSRAATFSPDIRQFVFGFASPSAVSGDWVAYQTQLEGADPEWSQPTREATREFTGLAAGRYAFHVRVLDRFGRAGPAATYVFVLSPPWYRTPLALGGYGLAGLLLAGATVRWRLAQLRRQNAKLNRLVTERTRELELSNTAKSEFLENISHELRNPLNGMLGMVGQLEEDRLQPQDRDALRTLKACSEQLTSAFEDVLGFSKLEYGYVKVVRKPFALRKALEDILTLYAPIARQRRSRLDVVWPEELADGFLGDVGKIKTVVGNFVTNALKYAPGSPVEIRVTTQPLAVETRDPFKGGSAAQPPDALNLLIEVVDHGPGIPAEEHELIFKKFVRGSGAKEQKIAGTGLGLATCAVLAKLMNGSVGVDSSPGRGATFHLRVLVRQVVLCLAAAADQTESVNRSRAALIVDDEIYNQAVLSGIALKLGFQPDVAGNAAEAHARLAERSYAVVFMDWELPGANGSEVAKQMRSQPDRTQPVILATTAHDSDEIREQCRMAGMDGFLLKPYNVEKVRHAFAEALARRARSDGNGSHTPATDLRAVRDVDALDLDAFEHYGRARPEEGEAASRLYRQAIELEMCALHDALTQGEEHVMVSSAHRLRSLAGLIGASELNAAASRMEQLARSGTVAERTAQGAVVAGAAAELLRTLARHESSQLPSDGWEYI